METKYKTAIIGFDGLHRAGKEVQISLLEKTLQEKGFLVKIIRGEGTRRGEGKDLSDPFSNWWRQKCPYIFNENNSLVEKFKKVNLVSQRINREAKLTKDFYLPREMKALRKEKGVLLMDRTFISRWFVMQQIFPRINLEDALYSQNPKNGMRVYPIIPDIIFVLDVPKVDLLNRCYSSDQTNKKDFRIANIKNYYELFEYTLSRLAIYKDYNICIIDGSQSIMKVHNKIILELQNYLNEL